MLSNLSARRRAVNRVSSVARRSVLRPDMTSAAMRVCGENRLFGIDLLFSIECSTAVHDHQRCYTGHS